MSGDNKGWGVDDIFSKGSLFCQKLVVDYIKIHETKKPLK